MRYLLVLLSFIVLPLQASNILNYDIFESESHVDIVLSLDAPYDGKIIQNKNSEGVVLSFMSLNLDKPFDKAINSNIIDQIDAKMSGQNETILTLKSLKNFTLSASKTSDGFGLRIRCSSTVASPINIEDIAVTIPDQQHSINIFMYIIYVCIILLLITIFIIALLWSRKLFFSNSKKMIVNSQEAWYFGDIEDNPDVTILFKKYLDEENYILLFELNFMRYMVLLGSNNLLLDKFGIYEDKNIKVFGEDNDKTDIQIKEEKLQSYKDKASSDIIENL